MFNGEDIKKKRKAERLSAEALAAMLRVSKESIYKWEKGTRPNNAEDYLKVENWLKNGKLESEFSNSGKGNTGPDAPGEIKSAEYSAKALFNLTESNRIQAESSKIQAENMTIIARSHEKLVAMLEGKVTAGDLKGILAAYEANIRALQGFVVDRFSAIQKQSPESVAAALGRKQVDLMKQVEQSGIHIG